MQYDAAIFILVDALGWEIYQRTNFLGEFNFENKKLRSILGYSSTCYPSIFSGEYPSVHGLWNSYYYSTKPISPSWIKYFKYLPKKIRNSWKVRNLVSSYLKSKINSPGYFSLYRVPFETLRFFGYAEETDILKPKGLKVESIFDIVDRLGLKTCIPHYATDDQKKIEQLLNALSSKNKPDFSFTALGSLDTFMHAHGPDGKLVDAFIKNLEAKVSAVIQKAKEVYSNPYIAIFSDHGMARVQATAPIRTDIETLGLNFGIDYVAFYDATMARFWFLNENAKNRILEKLSSEQYRKYGNLLSDEELNKEGCLFENYKYGESIFLTHEGIEIIPSFMSEKKLEGMHGYHPDNKASWATLISNKSIDEKTNTIKDIFLLMKAAAESVYQQNRR